MQQQSAWAAESSGDKAGFSRRNPTLRLASLGWQRRGSLPGHGRPPVHADTKDTAALWLANGGLGEAELGHAGSLTQPPWKRSPCIPRRAIADGKRSQILGSATLGIEGGEVMSALEIGNDGKTTIHCVARRRLRPPCFERSLNNLFVAMDSHK